MRSLIRMALGVRRPVALVDPRAVAVRRDPAPTRWAYRYQRLMLTPSFRHGVRIGIPLLLIAVIAGTWFSNPLNREMLATRIADLRTSIEHRPEFMVADYRITGANVSLAAAISDLIEVEFPISSFDLDLTELHAEVTDLTAVEGAVVRVTSDGMLEIAVTERQAVAVWRYTDGLRLLDRSGTMISMIAARSDRPGLPLIAGDGAKEHIEEAMALFAAAAPVAERVRGLVRMGERRWDMVLDRGQRILLPETEPVAALQRVIALHGAQDMLSRDIAVVDMRNGGRPTVRLASSAVIGETPVAAPAQVAD